MNFTTVKIKKNNIALFIDCFTQRRTYLMAEMAKYCSACNFPAVTHFAVPIVVQTNLC